MDNSRLENQIKELATEILEEYTKFYSEMDKKVLARRLCNMASEVAKEIIEEAEKIFMFTCSSLEAYTDWQNFKKKYTESEKDNG